METTPILVLMKEVGEEADNAITMFKNSKDTKLKQKERNMANDSYVESVRNVCQLVHAIEKLNQA